MPVAPCFFCVETGETKELPGSPQPPHHHAEPKGRRSSGLAEDRWRSMVVASLQTSAANPAISKIEIDDHLSANPLRELCNLGKGPLDFGVLRNSCLQLLLVRLVVLHND